MLRPIVLTIFFASLTVDIAAQGLKLEGHSLVLGTSSEFRLSGPALPSAPYQIALSLGDGPRFSVGSARIQLAIDDLFLASLQTSSLWPNFSGQLDATGFASSALNLPTDPALAGIDIYSAAIAIDAMGVVRGSNTIRREIRPTRPPLDFTALDQALQAFAVPGLAVGVIKDGQVVHRVALGGFTSATRIRTGSAVKWPLALLLLALVEDGVLSLDDRVSQWLPEFSGPKSTITIRQCFAHTSGLPGQALCLNDASLSLAQCVSRIANGPLLATPGTEFRYGGTSMQVVGRVMEVATGRPFQPLFQERVAGPLGLSNFTFDAFGVTDNPRVAGGGVCSLDDYLKILQAVLEGGVGLVGTDLIMEQAEDQTQGAPIIQSPQPADQRYGIGVWREEASSSGAAVRLSSPGFYGCYPWIDLARGYGAVIFVDRSIAEGRQIEAVVRPILEGLFPVEVVR